MSKYYDKAVVLREIESPHYNCAQATAMPFAEDAGLSEEMVRSITANFGGGLKRAATCGAIAGGLAVLGMYGVEDAGSIGTYYRKLKENHKGYLDCANLLRINKEQGGIKKPHCDAMVYECIQLAEEILREKGLLSPRG